MIHLYAVAREPAPTFPTGIDGAPVTTLPVGSLQAVVSRHDTPLTTSREHALTHAEVIAAVAGQVDAVPVQFAPGHADEQRLRRALQEQTELPALLDRVGGAMEFVIRPSARPSTKVPAVGDVPAAGVPGRAHEPGDGAGRAYLEDRRERLRCLADANAEAQARVAAVTEPLVGDAADVLDTRGRQGPERCFLVPREAAEAFGRRARQLAGEDFVVGGPWPPFSFAVAPESGGAR